MQISWIVNLWSEPFGGIKFSYPVLIVIDIQVQLADKSSPNKLLYLMNPGCIFYF
jgi:hypothetical protein